jgi:hypothetical protein
MTDDRVGRLALSEGRDLIYKGALGLAPGSAVQNLTQILNTYAEVGARWVATGYKDLGRLAVDPKLREILRRSNVLSEGHWKRVVGEIPNEARKRLSDFTMTLFQGAEAQNRIVSFFAGYRRALARGLSEPQALSVGRELAFRTQFRYDSASIPLLFQTSAGRTAFQLGQFGIRQAEFLRPFTTAGKIARGAAALSRGQLKQAREHLLDQDVKRMVRYLASTEAIIQSGYLADVDLRPWMRPVYIDWEASGGAKVRPGTFIIPFGPILSFGTSVIKHLKGSPSEARDIQRQAALGLPAGRSLLLDVPQVLEERRTGGKIREALSLKPAPRRTTLDRVLRRVFLGR